MADRRKGYRCPGHRTRGELAGRHQEKRTVLSCRVEAGRVGPSLLRRLHQPEVRTPNHHAGDFAVTASLTVKRCACRSVHQPRSVPGGGSGAGQQHHPALSTRSHWFRPSSSHHGPCGRLSPDVWTLSGRSFRQRPAASCDLHPVSGSRHAELAEEGPPRLQSSTGTGAMRPRRRYRVSV